MDSARRLLVLLSVLMLGALGWSGEGFAQKIPAPHGEIHVVDKSPHNWVSITLNVFEHLMELDKDGTLVPRLATDWQWLDDRILEVKLLLGFGPTLLIVGLFVLLAKRAAGGGAAGALGNFGRSRARRVDPQTIRFVFSEPDGGVLVKLSVMHIGNRQFYREVGWGEEHW